MSCKAGCVWPFGCSDLASGIRTQAERTWRLGWQRVFARYSNQGRIAAMASGAVDLLSHQADDGEV